MKEGNKGNREHEGGSHEKDRKGGTFDPKVEGKMPTTSATKKNLSVAMERAVLFILEQLAKHVEIPMEAIASRLEAMAIASRWEAIRFLKVSFKSPAIGWPR